MVTRTESVQHAEPDKTWPQEPRSMRPPWLPIEENFSGLDRPRMSIVLRNARFADRNLDQTM